MRTIPPEIARHVTATVTTAGVCWLWDGTDDAHRNCYTRDANRKVVRPVYYAWLLVRGMAAKGVLRPTCGNARCVNPDHHVRIAHYTSEQTECKRGHPLYGDNVYRNPQGGRECKTCRAERHRAHLAKQAVANGRRNTK